MINVLEMIKGFEVYIVVSLLIIVILLFIMLIVALKSINSLENRYRKLMRGADKNNLEEIIHLYMDKIDETKAEAGQLKQLFDDIDTRFKNCIQKVSIIRYRAFEDVGSDLSYSIAMLDHKNYGIILTGIYGRNDSTTYAKPIDKGISRYDLSEEEKQVLQNAIEKNI